MESHNKDDMELFREDLKTLETAWKQISEGSSDRDRVAILEELNLNLQSQKALQMSSYQLLRAIPQYWGTNRAEDEGHHTPTAAELLASKQLWPFARPQTNLHGSPPDSK